MRHALVLAALLAVLPASAEERATTQQAEFLVHKAVELIRKEGKPKAFAAFNDPNGPFMYRDLYIVAYDLDGMMRAHRTKEHVGKIRWDVKDPDGKYVVREGVALAKAKGKGWIDYRYKNPATGELEHKVAYVELVDGTVVTCGAYRP